MLYACKTTSCSLRKYLVFFSAVSPATSVKELRSALNLSLPMTVLTLGMLIYASSEKVFVL